MYIDKSNYVINHSILIYLRFVVITQSDNKILNIKKKNIDTPVEDGYIQ